MEGHRLHGAVRARHIVLFDVLMGERERAVLEVVLDLEVDVVLVVTRVRLGPGGAAGRGARRRIGALEAQLGSPLFARTPEGMTPTEAAHAIVPDVRRLEETALRIPQTLEARRDSPRGVVRVSAAPLVCSYVLLPLFAALCAEHDELQIDPYRFLVRGPEDAGDAGDRTIIKSAAFEQNYFMGTAQPFQGQADAGCAGANGAATTDR